MAPLPVSPAQPDGHGRGVMFFLLATVAFAFADALAKHLTGHLTVTQVVWGRFAFHLALTLLVLGLSRRPAPTIAKKLPQQMACSVLLFGAAACFYAALAHLPLAETVALYYIAPLLVTAMGAVLLREKVGPRRWLAVIIGLLGVLVIVRPGGDVFHWAALYSFGAAACFSLYQIVTRAIARDVSPANAMFFAALIGTIVASIAAPFDWIAPTPALWGLLVALGALGYAGQYFMFRALMLVPASTVAPYGYLDVLWAGVLGLAFFGDFPSGYSILGAGIVVGSGLYVFYRDRQLGRRPPPPPLGP